MIRRVLKAFICLLFVTNAAAQTPPSIEGVWRIAQRITPAGNPAANGVAVTQNNPAPSLLTGTYEMSGSMLIRHPTVAKNVDVMTRGSAIPFDVKFEDANTVWLIPGGDFASTEPRVKLTRLE